MRRLGAVLAGLMLFAAGTVAAAFASGAGPLGVLDSTSSSTTTGTTITSSSSTMSTSTTTPGTSTTTASTTSPTSTGGKVTICHHTHSATNPFVTITISVNAWPAHQRHGDTMGPCTTTTTTTAGTTTTAATKHRKLKHHSKTKHNKVKHHTKTTSAKNQTASHGGNSGQGHSGHSHP